MIHPKGFLYKSFQNTRVVLLLMIVLVCLSAFLALQFIKHETRQMKNEKAQFLKTTTDLKVERLSYWYNDEMADAALIARNIRSFKVFNNFLTDSTSSETKDRLRNYLRIIRAEHGYEDIFITSSTGKLLISANELYPEFTIVLRNTINKAIVSEKTEFSDIYACQSHKTAHIDIVSSVSPENGKSEVFMVFRINPFTDVFPLFSYWPDSKFFHEIKLVRKVGDSISVFNLDQLSGYKPAINTFFDDGMKYPSRIAANGFKGFFEGMDTRGVKVLSYSRAVDGTPWSISAKMNVSDIYKDLNKEMYLLISSVVLFVFLIFIGFFFLQVNRKRRMYKSLWQAKEEFKTTIYSIGDGVIITDNEGKVKNMNPVAEFLTGWQEKDALNKEIDQVFRIVNYSDPLLKVENPVHKVIQQGAIAGLANHTALISKKGDKIPIADSGAPIRNEDGEITGVVLVFRDQSDEYFYRREIEASQATYRRLFEENPQPMYIFDVETLAFLEVNEAMVKHYGYSRDELLDMTLKDIRPPEDVPALMLDLAGISEPQDISGEWRHLKKDGTLIHVFIATHSVVYNNKNARHVMANDITNLKVAEKELKHAEAYYRALIENAPDGIVLLGEDFKIKYASPSARRIFGFNSSEAILPEPSLATHPDDLDKVVHLLGEILEDPTKIKTLEYRFETKTHTWRWISSTFRNLLHVPGVNAIIINFRDITERKLVENEKNRLSGIIESSVNEIFIFNAQSLKFEYINQWAFKNLGYTPDEMKNFYPWDIAPSFNKESVQSLLQPLLNGEKALIVFETFQKRKNSSLYPVEVRLQMLPQSENASFFALVADITERKMAAESLVRSEEKFRNLFVNHAAIKLIVDPESLNILDANHAAAAFYGWSISELTSMNMSQINTLSIGELKAYVDEIQERQNVTFEFRHKLKNGDVRVVEVFSSIVQIEDQNFIHTIVHDVTAKKEVQQRLNVLIRSLEQSPVGVIITNCDGVIEYINPKYSEITGYSIDEMVDTLPGILQKDSGGKADHIWDLILSGKEWFGENEYITKNGVRYWGNVAISPVINEYGEIRNFVIVKEDISGQKKLLKDLVEAKEAAEESDRLKSAFLANMSHEIRTPMNGILGFMELLKEPDLTGEMRDEYVEIVNASGQRLLETINDIIDISKIESGELELNLVNVDVIKMMHRLGHFFEPEARRKNLELILETNITQKECLLLLDSHKTESVLTNLLKNAIKFTSRGQIVLGCNLNGKNLIFYVRDTGRGIHADKLSRIFDRFVQAESSYSRAYEGSGLGLSISKAYIEFMGGHISVDSEPDKGSDFQIIIPVEKECVQEPPVKHHPEIPDQGLYDSDFVFLIAEDDDISFLLMKRLFKNYNITLLRAINGQDAVEKCLADPAISLVLMDIKMPVMDGHTATREIHKSRPGLPVIALTAYALKEDREKALESGCIDYLSKPVSRELLLQKLAKHTKFKT